MRRFRAGALSVRSRNLASAPPPQTRPWNLSGPRSRGCATESVDCPGTVESGPAGLELHPLRWFGPWHPISARLYGHRWHGASRTPIPCLPQTPRVGVRGNRRAPRKAHVTGRTAQPVPAGRLLPLAECHTRPATLAQARRHTPLPLRGYPVLSPPRQ